MRTKKTRRMRSLKINKTTIDLIKKWEGLYLHSYQDAVGVWTIGWGITSADKAIIGTSIKKGMTISKETAERWLMESLEKKYLPKVMKYDDTYHWNENEAGAMVSFAYNIGNIDQLTAYGTRSKAMIADKLLLYCKADGKKLKGLLDRRKDERRLFLTPCNSSKYNGTLPTKFPTRGYFKVGDGYLSAHSMTAEIKAIQAFLNWALRNTKGHKELALDGLYGGNTKKMVTLFQRDRGLKENGCFGKLCLAEAKKMI